KEALEEFSADAIRLFMLTSHYRSPLSYSSEGVAGAERAVARLRAAVTPRPTGEPAGEPDELAQARQNARNRFVEVMEDDFNTAAAISLLHDLAREINRARDAGSPPAGLVAAQNALLQLGGVLGLRLEEPKE